MLKVPPQLWPVLSCTTVPSNGYLHFTHEDNEAKRGTVH